MVRMVTDKPQTTSRELQEHLAADGVVVQRSTIQHTLHLEKLIRRAMRKKSFLSIWYKKSRMRYAKAHLDKPEAFWKKILWSDETKIELFGQNKRGYAWWEKNHTEFHEKWLVQVVETLLKLRATWIPLSISRSLTRMFKSRSQSWSYAGVGFFSRAVILSTVQNPPRNSCRRTSTVFWNGHPSPQTLTSLKMYWKYHLPDFRDLSVAIGGVYSLLLQQKEVLLNMNGIISLGSPNVCTCLLFCLIAHKNVSVGPIKMISLLRCSCFHNV